MGKEDHSLFLRRKLLGMAGIALTAAAIKAVIPNHSPITPESSAQISGCLIDHKLVTRNLCPEAFESSLANVASNQSPETSIPTTETLKIIQQQSQKTFMPVSTTSPEPQATSAPQPAESPTPVLQLPQAQAKENKEVSFECSVLYYHEISPAQFKADLMNLISKGYKPLTLERYVAILKGEENIPSYPTFLVTFDDGLKSQLKAIPVIEEIQKQTGDFVPLTIFSIMKFGGMDDKTIAQMVNHKPLNGEPYWGDAPSFYDGDHKYLSAIDLVNLVKKDWISVQPHTTDHVNLTKSSEKETQNQILPAEIRTDQIYEAAGKKRTVRAFAYPFGAYNLKIENFLASIGIDVAFTTEGRTTQTFSRREMLPRIRKS